MQHSNDNACDYSHVFKVLLIGDSNVGKTSLLGRYHDDSFTESSLNTIGVDFRIKTVESPDEKTKVKLQIWDTAGQDRFSCIVKTYFRGAHLVFVVYDASNPDGLQTSLRSVQKWVETAKAHCHPDKQPLFVLVANKADVPGAEDLCGTSIAPRVTSFSPPTSVSTEAGSCALRGAPVAIWGEEKLREWGVVAHVAASAKTGKGVREMVELGVSELMKRGMGRAPLPPRSRVELDDEILRRGKGGKRSFLATSLFSCCVTQ